MVSVGVTRTPLRRFAVRRSFLIALIGYVILVTVMLITRNEQEVEQQTRTHPPPSAPLVPFDACDQSLWFPNQAFDAMHSYRQNQPRRFHRYTGECNSPSNCQALCHSKNYNSSRTLFEPWRCTADGPCCHNQTLVQIGESCQSNFCCAHGSQCQAGTCQELARCAMPGVWCSFGTPCCGAMSCQDTEAESGNNGYCDRDNTGELGDLYNYHWSMTPEEKQQHHERKRQSGIY